MTNTRAQARSARWRAVLGVVAAALWIIVGLVVVIHGWKTAHLSQAKSHTVIATYFGAGQNWLDGKPLYSGGRGFVYSPLAAAFFAPFAALPPAAGNILWLVLSMGVFGGALWWCWKDRLFPSVQIGNAGILFLLVLPLAIGNFHNGQVNPLAAALLLGGILAVERGWFWLAAFAVACCVYLKIYPIAMGLLLLVAWPREFSWRFVIALVALAAFSLILQRPSFVVSQYALWFSTRAADDRSVYDIDIAPRDLRMLMRALHISVSAGIYMAMQLASAATLAATVALGKFRLGWSNRRVLVATYSLGTCWMLLCGPATESATYVLLAPAVAFGLVASLRRQFPGQLRIAVFAALGILLCALFMNSFLHLKKDSLNMAVQPLGALVFAGFAAGWISRQELWIEDGPVSRGESLGKA